MDIEFVVQDTFALTRPQWSYASNLEEATKALHTAIMQDQKTAGADKMHDVDDASSRDSSDDENADVEDVEHEIDIDDESEYEEDDVEVLWPVVQESNTEPADNAVQDGDDVSVHGSDFHDETIVVTRQEEAADPEDEAEFEREYAKMMADSLESRKFERKQLFDVPLPVRAKNREASVMGGQDQESVDTGSKMAFSLLTKRGNRQQVCPNFLSPFALAYFGCRLN